MPPKCELYMAFSSETDQSALSFVLNRGIISGPKFDSINNFYWIYSKKDLIEISTIWWWKLRIQRHDLWRTYYMVTT